MARKHENFGFNLDGKSAHARIAVAAQYARFKREPAALFECVAVSAAALSMKSVFVSDLDMAAAVRGMLKEEFGRSVSVRVRSGRGVGVFPKAEEGVARYAVDAESAIAALGGPDALFLNTVGRTWDPYADYQDWDSSHEVGGVLLHWTPVQVSLPHFSECVAALAAEMGAQPLDGRRRAEIEGMGWGTVAHAFKDQIERSALLVVRGSDYTAAAAAAAALGLSRVCVCERRESGYAFPSVWKSQEMAAA